MRTHVPDFWEDQKKAEAQMKKVKALHFWIDSYTEIEKSVEELRLAFDFVKEGIVSEEEVDEIYKRTTELIENLELRNMLCAENQFGSRRNRVARLGIDVDAYVLAMVRTA